MRLERPISLDDKYLKMAGLGDLSLTMRDRFVWVTRHEGVLVQATDGGDELLVPEAFATNPYEAIEKHWRFLTEGVPVLVLTTGSLRHAFWSGRSFTEIEV